MTVVNTFGSTAPIVSCLATPTLLTIPTTFPRAIRSSARSCVFWRSARSASINTPGKFADELLATPITDHPPSTGASAVARPMPFDAPVMTMDLTIAAAQLLPSLPACRQATWRWRGETYPPTRPRRVVQAPSRSHNSSPMPLYQQWGVRRDRYVGQGRGPE